MTDDQVEETSGLPVESKQPEQETESKATDQVEEEIAPPKPEKIEIVQEFVEKTVQEFYSEDPTKHTTFGR